MNFKKFLELHEVSMRDFSHVTGIPLRQVFRYANEGVHPSIVNAVKIKAFTDGKVMLEDWVTKDGKPRRSLQDIKSEYFSNKKRYKKSLL